MATVYKVLNPADGQYTTHVTLNLCLEHAIKVAYEFYLTHTHGHPYSVVTTRVDGSEVWKTPEGVEIPSPEEIKEKIRSYAAQLEQKITSNAGN
jgi:hypothetical protein